MRLSVLSLSLMVVACGDDGDATGDPATSGDTPGTGSAGTTTGDPDPTSTTSPTGDPSTDPTGDPTGDPTTDPTETPPNCGDGNLDADEQCDAGAANSNTGDCTSICTKANCGDGWVQTGKEECDDANIDYSDACAAGCKLQECGDGHLGKAESCDDGNDVDDDECSNDCAPGSCGNGQIDVGEECDDGNANDDDGCTNQCTMGGVGPACNDGMKNGDETDVDCGGSCNGCADGEGCGAPADCTSGSCNAGVCEPGNQVALDPVNCAPAMVGVDAAFAGAIMGNCGCHGMGSGGLTFSDAATFKAATVNVKASVADMNRVTPGNIDASYVLYKLHGQQAKVPGGGGSQMPLGGAQLADDKLCLMINWVKSIK